MVETVALEPTDLEVLDDDVGMRGEPGDQRAPLLRFEIGSDRALAAVAAMEVAGGEIAAVRRRHERRPPASRVVAASGTLDLDDVGAEIGEKLPGPWTGEDAGKLENAQPVQGGMHRGFEIRLAGQVQAPRPT